MFDSQILTRSSSIYLATKQCDKGSATQIYWSNMYQKFSTWLKLVNFCGQNQIVLKLFMVVSILGTYFTLSNQETTLNCINIMVHWKAYTTAAGLLLQSLSLKPVSPFSLGLPVTLLSHILIVLTSSAAFHRNSLISCECL